MRRRTPAGRSPALLVTLTLLALSALLLAGCGQSSDPEPSVAADATASPSASRSPAPPGSPSGGAATTPALPYGETATVAGFALTPLTLQARTGPVYDRDGEAIQGEGFQVAIRVEKQREPDAAGEDPEFVVPVATLVGSEGERVRMDDFFGLPPSQAQSSDYNERYVKSFQYAVIQPPGAVSKALLWFSVPAGMTPQTLVIDAGRRPDGRLEPGVGSARPNPRAPRAHPDPSRRWKTLLTTWKPVV